MTEIATPIHVDSLLVADIATLVPDLREADRIRLAGLSGLVEQYDVPAPSLQAILDEAHINPINTSLALRPDIKNEHFLEVTIERQPNVIFDDDSNSIPREWRKLVGLTPPDVRVVAAAQKIAESRLVARLTANPGLADTAALPNADFMAELRRDRLFNDRVRKFNQNPQDRFHYLRTQTRLIAGLALHAVGRTF
ncbi:MAG TPA: hypothetical protein VLF59_04005 [Candidatus Saccharimonadales bacterium]|nr:hypothetical protein [Candidatus Saccharimonadales bacterium]